MGNRAKTDKFSEKEIKQLVLNMYAMKARFQGEPFCGEGLSQLRRKATGHDKSHLEFQKKLQLTQPLLFKLASENVLPDCSTIYKVETGKDKPSPKFVKAIADFCTQAFSFDKTITADDLLTSTLSFPPLRRVNERWERYVGTYRCFYPYQSENGLELRGGILDLSEKEGDLLCRFVTGIRKDERFIELMEWIKLPTEELIKKLEQYGKNLTSHELRPVVYEGSAEVSDGYFHFKAQRADNNNVAWLILRRFDTSSQPHYSGCIATVTLCREDDVVTYPMAVSLPDFSMKNEKEMLLRYLKSGIHGEAGLNLSVDMDKKWNRSINDWYIWQEENGR